MVDLDLGLAFLSIHVYMYIHMYLQTAISQNTCILYIHVRCMQVFMYTHLKIDTIHFLEYMCLCILCMYIYMYVHVHVCLYTLCATSAHKNHNFLPTSYYFGCNNIIHVLYMHVQDTGP